MNTKKRFLLHLILLALLVFGMMFIVITDGDFLREVKPKGELRIESK